MGLYWYALRTKPHKEPFVHKQLQAREEVAVFFPALRVKPVNPRSRKIRPYFPGYLFVQADLEVLGQNAFSWLPGVVGLVRFGGEAAVVPENLIHELQQRLAKAQMVEKNRHRFQPGDRVRVVSGPLSGYEGIFDTHLSGADRVQILLAFLSTQEQRVKLDADDIIKLT